VRYESTRTRLGANIADSVPGVPTGGNILALRGFVGRTGALSWGLASNKLWVRTCKHSGGPVSRSVTDGTGSDDADPGAATDDAGHPTGHDTADHSEALGYRGRDWAGCRTLEGDGEPGGTGIRL
jgi:hypothetical protein